MYWRLDKEIFPKKNQFVKSYTIVRALNRRTLNRFVFFGFKNQFTRSMDRGFHCSEVNVCCNIYTFQRDTQCSCIV